MKFNQRLTIAGKELVKGNFGNAIKSLSASIPIIPNQYRGAGNLAESFWMFNQLGGYDYFFSYGDKNSALVAYQDCPPVNAIINRKAQAFINGKTCILNSQDKEAVGVEAKKIRNLMLKPNSLQSWKQFEAQGYIYQQLFGYNIILPIKPVGFDENIDAVALWNIPPFMVDIEETNKLFYTTDTKGIISKIVLKYKNTKTEINAKDIFIMKDFTPSMESLVIPESRICALELPINNIIGAYESRNVLINYRGALGILSNDPGSSQFAPVAVTPEDKESLQNDFMRYGVKNDQWKFIITSASLKWQSMGYPTKDLMLFEEVQDSIMRICDSYNYPHYLLAQEKGTTFANLNEAKKLLYQDAIIPEAENVYEQWNHFFGLSKYNLRIDKDFTHLAVLQEDKVQEAQSRKFRNDALLIEWMNNLITRDTWLKMNNMDPLPEGQDGEMYYHEWIKAHPPEVQNDNKKTEK